MGAPYLRAPPPVLGGARKTLRSHDMTDSKSDIRPVLRELPFTVDTWAAAHSSAQFLTHAHKDHTGREPNTLVSRGRRVLCTALTRQLLAIRFPSLCRTVQFEDLPEEGESRTMEPMLGEQPGSWLQGESPASDPPAASAAPR